MVPSDGKVNTSRKCSCCASLSLFRQNILEQMALRKESTMEGCLNTLAEGSSLIEQLRSVVRSRSSRAH